MRRVSLLVLFICLTAGLVFGAGTEESEDTASAVLPTAPGTFPVVDEKVTLVAFAPQYANVEDMETNGFTVMYEEMSNVHIDWELAPEQGFQEKRNLVLASGDYPDIFLASGFNLSDQLVYGELGVLVDLAPLMEEWSVWFKEHYETGLNVKEVITTPSGAIYATGQNGECEHCKYAQRLWINQVWLDNLGLAMPQTTQEYFDALVAFRDLDANGNGDPSDETPMSGAEAGGWMARPVPFLMNAFIYDSGGNGDARMFMEDGVVDVPYNKPEWREGLQYVNSLVEAGLLDPTAFTMNNQTLRTLVKSDDEFVIGAMTSGWQGVFMSAGDEGIFDYAAVPPLEGPNGFRASYFASNPGIGHFAITSANEMPEVSMRWVDWMFSWEGRVQQRIGREGFEWARGGPDDLGIDGQTADWVKLTPIGGVQNVFWGQGGWPGVFPHSRQGGARREQMLYDESINKMAPYAPDEVVLPFFVAADVSQEFAQLETDLNDYVDEASARFAVGDLNFDDDWEDYLANLDAIGVDRYLEIVNEAYTTKYGN